MAIYHLNVKNISRGDGRSVVAAAAYRAGEVLPNDAEEKLSDFGGRRDVITSGIRLPMGAPDWMADRTTLWNAVELAEKRHDARLAKEIEFALPREIPRSAWLAVAHAMSDAYTAQGFAADFAIHDDGTQHNPHVHILLTTRVITPEGFGPKIRSADSRQFISDARVTWERIANAALKTAGVTATIDSRSYAKRKLDRQAGQHRGPDKQERRARRQRQREREKMVPTHDDRDLPVPDPDGNPIHPRELAAAEGRMLSDLEREEPPVVQEPNGDPTAARQAIARQNSREMSEDTAAAYRLVPEDTLDWLTAPISEQDVSKLERWENHLDWLEAADQRPSTPAGDGSWQEPDHERR
ncbi:MobA/MobL family protein [Agrobacterium tumefaciens]|uniref:MobQ family relaxase n=1 Tax=Agrobacterium tumefaciens TaxID=358 RepID=UPI00080FE902|nr:MobQ family relaxase [Agrobacterium tumefaciens]NSZ04204.1 MobA/MobL family protein [Agrobacterium tumefaciens]NSZ36132.1 MobA/MobL family protein [Agrobacterium tumefaciens]NTB02226.1 MobA/MobL family protein [Agrobacterium tumefaciens]NTB22066.1 MobA/MobL family protein [Agrobacterium tumefaciens]NTB27452.1 MobA/MobL family protein [Agrobacterium tumefaciens]